MLGGVGGWREVLAWCWGLEGGAGGCWGLERGAGGCWELEGGAEVGVGGEAVANSHKRIKLPATSTSTSHWRGTLSNPLLTK